MTKELLNSVVISNEFTRYGIFDFTVTEWRIFLYAVSKIRPDHFILPQQEIRLRDFCTMFKISSYADVRNACRNLETKTITVKDKKYQIFNYCVCNDNVISFQIHDDISEFLLEQYENMTIFDLGYISTLASKYSLRMYLYVCSFKKLNRYNMSVKTLIKIMNSYRTASEVTRRILAPALKEINEKTNLKFCVKRNMDRFHFYCRERYASEIAKMNIDDWRVAAEEDKKNSTVDFEELEKELFKEEIAENERLSFFVCE